MPRRKAERNVSAALSLADRPDPILGLLELGA